MSARQIKITGCRAAKKRELRMLRRRRLLIGVFPLHAFLRTFAGALREFHFEI